MQGLNALVTSGKVLYLGVSDTPAWVVAKANQYARDHGLAQFVYVSFYPLTARLSNPPTFLHAALSFTPLHLPQSVPRKVVDWHPRLRERHYSHVQG
jgi:hypothetical protein